MNKKIIGIGISIGIVIVIGLVIFNQSSTIADEEVQASENIVMVQNSSIVEGNEVWEKFKENSLNGNSGEIKIVKIEEGEQYNYTLEYDEELFSYYDDENTFLIKKKCLLDVSGKVPLSEKESRLVALANREYTFDELFASTNTNDSASFIDFEIIFWQ